jgi:hypothetical protein
MVKWLYKILFILLTFSFFTSAVEMDIGENHHTFFDEYDTYVKAEQVSFHVNAPVQDHNIFSLVSLFTINQFAPGIEQSSVKNQFNACINHFPSRLFLRNSVWRI